MPYVIGGDCIDQMDRSCVEECPVDCIYEGERKLYIHPDECIDCGACEAACPLEAIAPLRRLSDDDKAHGPDNARFFAEVLPGRDGPLGSPGGASAVGPIGVDTPFVQGLEGSS